HLPPAFADRDLIAEDFNRDGLLDLAVVHDRPSSEASDSIMVFLNSPGSPGTFATGTEYAPPGDDPHSLAAADVNGDGFPDILAVIPGAGDPDQLFPLLNNAANPGSFQAGQPLVQERGIMTDFLV